MGNWPFLVSLLIGTCVLCVVPRAFSAQHDVKRIPVKGIDREYIVQTPLAGTPGPYPLVVVLHGSGGKLTLYFHNHEKDLYTGHKFYVDKVQRKRQV